MIFAGVLSVFLTFIPETYAPVILKKKAARYGVIALYVTFFLNFP